MKKGITSILILLVAMLGVFVWLGFIYRVPDMKHLDSSQDPLVAQPGSHSRGYGDVLRQLKDYHSGSLMEGVHSRRKKFKALFARPTDIAPIAADADGVPAEWMLAEGADPDVRVLYIHGGAFHVGGLETHRYITSEISRRAGVAVLAIEYRKRPEFKLKHTHEDVRTAYKWILRQGPKGPGEPKKLFVAGDSAGGNLSLSVIAWARDQGLRTVDGAIALAPLTDATMSSPSWEKNRKTDPFLGPGVGRTLKVPKLIRQLVTHIQGGIRSNDPALSPLLGDLRNLPPTLIQVSRNEMLHDDAQRYANKARLAGSQVSLQVWPDMFHVFQAFEELPESSEALDMIAAFILHIRATS